MASKPAEPGFPTSLTWAEPAPNWYKVLRSWRELWHCYRNVFGSLYLLVVVYSTIVLWFSRRSFQRKKFCLPSLNIMLVVMGSTRSTCLFLNPYSALMKSSEALVVISIILTGVGGACVTSAISILLLIFLDSTKTTLGPSKLTRLPVFLSITALNIVYVVVADLVVWSNPEARLMVLICQVTFSIWGFLITIGYLVAGARMRRNLNASHLMSSYNNSFHAESKRLHRLLRLLLACALLGMLYFVLSIYVAASTDFGVLSENIYVENEWNWFAIQTVSRILELSVSVLMLAITTQSMRNEATYPSDRNRCKMGKADKFSRGCTSVLHGKEEPTSTVGLDHREQITSF